MSGCSTLRPCSANAGCGAPICLSGADTAVFANVLPKWDSAESILAPGPYGSETVAYDPASIRPYPFEPRAAALVADYTGPQAEIMPRRVLARQIERAAAAGFDVLAAYEFEFIVLNETADSLREKGFANLSHFAADNRCWSGQTAATHAGFVADLEALLRAADIDLFALGVELGPGCLEATLRHKPAMRAADDAAFFRMFTKAFCRQRGLTASFMPLLGAGFPGIGGHVACRCATGSPARMSSPIARDPHGLSKAAQSFLAGIIDVVPRGLPDVRPYRQRLSPACAGQLGAEDCELGALQLCRRRPHRRGDRGGNAAGAAAAGRRRQCLSRAGLDARRRAGWTGAPPAAEGCSRSAPADPTRFRPTRRACPPTCSRPRAGSAPARPRKRLFGATFVEHFAMICEAEDAALRRAVSAAEVQRYLEGG